VRIKNVFGLSIRRLVYSLFFLESRFFRVRAPMLLIATPKREEKKASFMSEE
jgi:hypothetical protein